MLRIKARRFIVSASALLISVTVLLTTYASFVGWQTSVSDKFEVELVTLRPAGFEPAKIQRQKGPFVLMVDDRSGLEKTSLKLSHQNGDQVRHLKTDRRSTQWHDVLDLPPGEYLLTEADHPDWICRVTLLP